MRIDEFLHTEIRRGRTAVDLGADHHVTLFDAQRVHCYGAVRHDAKRLTGIEHGLPHRATLVRRYVDFVGELARITDAEQARGDVSDRRSDAACNHGEKWKRVVGNIDVDELRERLSRLWAGERCGRPMLGHRGRVYV